MRGEEDRGKDREREEMRRWKKGKGGGVGMRRGKKGKVGAVVINERVGGEVRRREEEEKRRQEEERG